MKIKTGDKVIIISGKDKGRSGKVTKALPRAQKLVIEGINLVKRHLRPKREGEKGQIVEVTKPIALAKVKLVCPVCSQPTRVGYKITGGKKFRICKKCKKEL